jgi:hypothetical protein
MACKVGESVDNSVISVFECIWMNPNVFRGSYVKACFQSACESAWVWQRVKFIYFEWQACYIRCVIGIWLRNGYCGRKWWVFIQLHVIYHLYWWSYGHFPLPDYLQPILSIRDLKQLLSLVPMLILSPGWYFLSSNNYSESPWIDAPVRSSISDSLSPPTKLIRVHRKTTQRLKYQDRQSTPKTFALLDSADLHTSL